MDYLDTSALAKWYLRERGSEEFAAWVQDRGEIVASSLALVEMRSLLARRVTSGELSVPLAERVWEAFEDDLRRGFLSHYRIDDSEVIGALALFAALPEHPLRALDAIHLNVARVLDAEVLATADRVMAGAARSLGLSVAFFG